MESSEQVQAFFNRFTRARKRSSTIPESCPPWATPSDIENWQARGVVVWDNSLQRVEVLTPIEAIQLLDALRASDNWKSDGIRIYKRYSRITLPVQAISSRKRKKKAGQPDPSVVEDQPTNSKWEDVQEERMRLIGQAALNFFALLEDNETPLREMAETDSKAMRQSLKQVYDLLFQVSQRAKSKEIDIGSRAMPWRFDEEAVVWTCDAPPNRATVALVEGNIFWEVSIERPNRFKRLSPNFLEIAEALAWAERELAVATQEGSAVHEEDEEVLPKLSVMTLTEDHRARLAPYWIDPSALEVDHITYRVTLSLEYQPLRSKTMEMSFGKLFHYAQEYPTPSILARELQLDLNQVDVKDAGGLYFILSSTSYFQEQLAVAQAQQLWERSMILKRHQEGKVIMARYGFQEVETGYCTWLGGVAGPNYAWPKEPNRAAYLADRALVETLAYAFDIDGFRAYLGFSRKTFKDEDLQELLHRTRVKSKNIPNTLRLESEAWLRSHRQL